MLALALAALVGGLVQGGVGFGAGVVVAAVAVSGRSPAEVVCLTQAAVGGAAAVTLLREGRPRELARVRLLLGGAAGGVLLGFGALSLLDRPILRGVIAAALIPAGLFVLRRPAARKARPGPTDVLGGVAIGAAAGGLGLGGPVTGAFLTHRGEAGRTLRRTSAAVLLPLAVFAFTGGVINGGWLVATAPALVLAGVGAALGGLVAARLPDRGVRSACGIAVALAGLDVLVG